MSSNGAEPEDEQAGVEDIASCSGFPSMKS